MVDAIVEFIAGPLARDPHRVGKRLMGELADFHSARRGDHRVIYEIHDQTVVVTIVDVGHRADIHRR